MIPEHRSRTGFRRLTLAGAAGRMKDGEAGFRRFWTRLEDATLDIVGAENDADANAEQRLVASLLQASVLQQGTLGRSDRANIERYGWVMTIKGCVDLINSNPDLAAYKLAAPLVRLQVALEDLDRGRVHPGLRPRKRSRHETGPRSRLDSTLRGHVAGIVEGLMRRGGMSEPEAVHWVHRRLSARRVQLTAEQLEQWRKEARGAKRDDFMRVAFHKVQVVDWTNPEATADALIEGFLKLI